MVEATVGHAHADALVGEQVWRVLGHAMTFEILGRCHHEHPDVI